MAERQHAGETQKEIHRHRRPNGGECEKRPHFAPEPFAAHVIMPSSPNRPRGRISRTTAISTYMMASLADGKNTAVTPDATPISSPPNKVPTKLPTPPTMMAMKLGISRP